MPTDWIRTSVCLQPTLRRRLDEKSTRTGVAVSVLVRDAIANSLDGGTRITRADWIEYALRLLLRFHPQGDLEKLSDGILESLEKCARD